MGDVFRGIYIVLTTLGMPWTEEEKSDTIAGLGLKREDVLRGIDIFKQLWECLGLKRKKVIRLGTLY